MSKNIRNMIVREKDPVERDSFIKTLESMGFRKDIDDPRGRQEIIDAVLPITVNVAEKIYGMIGNKTCAAAATSSGLVMTKEEFSESLRINYMDNSSFYDIAKKYESDANIEKAYQYYMKAAMREDDERALKRLGDMYFWGQYVSQNYEMAGKYYSMAYDRGFDVGGQALILAGNFWELTSEDMTPALKFYQAAADRGENYGHECLGELYYRQGKYAEAYEQLKQVDELNCCGLYYLGKLYDEGQAVEQDTEKAIELYRQVVDSAEKVANIVGMDQHALKAKKRLAELGVNAYL